MKKEIKSMMYTNESENPKNYWRNKGIKSPNWIIAAYKSLDL